MSSREPPVGVSRDAWLSFERWADDNGIEVDPDDWKPWWNCFKSGYNIGHFDARMNLKSQPD